MKIISYSTVLLSLAMILQSCSWLHVIQIRNTTQEVWTIEYQINDQRGVFSNEVLLRKSKKETEKLNEFTGNIISFKIKPGQTATIGSARNSHYEVYKKYTTFDPEIPWKAFINTGTIKISNTSNSFELKPAELTKVLTKNNRVTARIDIKKVIENTQKGKP